MTGPKFELWRAVQWESAYTHMVWSIEEDVAYWFKNEEDARAYLAARRRGDSKRADALAENAA